MKQVALALVSVVAGALAVGCKREAPPAPPASAAPVAAAAPAAPAAPPAPAPGAPAPPAASAPVPAGPDPCPAICERTRPLKCKRAAACRELCQQMRQVDSCGAEMATVLSCFARQPLSSWLCSEEGDAAMKDGFCDKQQEQFVRCMQKGAGAVQPPATRAL